MSKYKYSTTIGEKEVAAVGVTLPISTKQSIEICAFLRGKKLARAKAILSNVIEEKEAIPFKRFTDGVGHRRGNLTSGRYPKKASTFILKLLNSAQANAQFKGLSSSDLIVRHISAQKGSNTFRHGRRRTFAKKTSIEIVLAEADVKKGMKKEAQIKTAEPIKPVEKKEIPIKETQPEKIENSKKETKLEPKINEEKAEK